MSLVGKAHTMLHEKGVMRIQTDIRVGSRYAIAFWAASAHGRTSALYQSHN